MPARRAPADRPPAALQSRHESGRDYGDRPGGRGGAARRRSAGGGRPRAGGRPVDHADRPPGRDPRRCAGDARRRRYRGRRRDSGAAVPHRARTPSPSSSARPSPPMTAASVSRCTPTASPTYQVTIPLTLASADAQVGVIDPLRVRTRALPLGRAGVSVLIRHPSDLHWNGVRVAWQFALGRRGRFASAPATRTIRLGPYVTLLRTTATLPAGRFRWRACFRAPADHALLDPQQPAGCGGRGYAGTGELPAGFPNPGAVRRATSLLAVPGRQDGVRDRRQRGTAVRLARALDVRVGQRGQGDAAGGLPAPARPPRAAPNRRLQRVVPVSDDQRLRQFGRHPDVVDRRGRGPVRSGARRRNDRLLDRRDLGQRADLSRRPGALLLRTWTS